MDWFISDYNFLAHRAVESYNWAAAPQTLLIYGPAGVGKTKLLSWLVSNMRKSGVRVNFLNALHFSRQFSQAVQEKNLSPLRSKWRSSELLLVDGLDLLPGKSASIEELYHTYEHLSQRGGKMVFSLRADSLHLEFLGARFASRLMSGVVVGIDYPKSWELERFIEIEVRRLRLALERELIPALAQHVKNPQEAKAELENFIRFAAAKEDALSYHCFSQYWCERTAREETALHPDNIVRLVAETMQVSIQEIKGNSRRSRLNEARQIAIYLIRTYTDLSYSQIGAYFGRGHTAMIEACHRLESKTSEDPQLDSKVKRFRMVLEERGGSAMLDGIQDFLGGGLFPGKPRG
ncbi:MAG: helix-turn-helix domain-containing protein [Desulfitobacteriaceae bacterium]